MLKFADGFTSTRSPDKLIHVLELYGALGSSAPGLLPLFTGKHGELISRQVPVVLAKLERALRAATGGLVAKIRTDSSRAEGVGVHPLARYAMTCVELLAPHREALDLILANAGEDPAGGAEGVASFGGLVSELIAGMERNLEEKSAVACAGGSLSRHLFLANNTSFVLSRAADAGVASLLGGDWAARRRGRLEQHAASYLEASWGPAVACLEAAAGGGGKPARALAKFNAAFEEARGSQAGREVPDPAFRAALREAVSEMVVPAYRAFLEKHPKLGKSVRYTAADVAQSLSELFEGDTGMAENRW